MASVASAWPEDAWLPTPEVVAQEAIYEAFGGPVSALRPPLWRPIKDPAPGVPSPQRQAYESEADELFFGGGAGGGKSDMLLGLAFTRHRRSIIFRREYEQIKGLIDRSREIARGAGHYNRQDKRWTMLDGRVAEFGGMQRDDDWEKFQGRPHDLIGFDELPHFSRLQYRSVIGWNRTDDPSQRCRVVATGNPPTTAEGEWVIEEWGPWLDENHPDPAAPGELRWYRYTDDDQLEWYHREDLQEDEQGLFVVIKTEEGPENQYLRSRTFIPALVDDNPYYVATGYKGRLQALPEPLRSQMLKGLFNVETEDAPYQVIPTAWVKAAQQRWKKLHADSGDGASPFKPGVPMTALGGDVARGGKAETVLAPRYGTYVGPLQCHPGSSTPDGPAVAALVLQALEPGSVAVIDVLGVGSGVEDALTANSVPFVAFDAGAGSDATDRTGLLKMVNKRAEAWWRMRELLDPANGYDIALPDDRQLRADLCAPRFRLTVRGILIESKEDLAKRIGRSTDRGDAVVMAFEDVPVLDWIIS